MGWPINVGRPAFLPRLGRLARRAAGPVLGQVDEAGQTVDQAAEQVLRDPVSGDGPSNKLAKNGEQAAAWRSGGASDNVARA